MVEFKKLFRREKLVEALKNFGALRPRISHSSLTFASLLFIVLLLALTIRLLPMRWGTYLSEFDPYWQYRLTEHMVENGFTAWTSWRDHMSWYPYGRDAAATSFPGLAFTAASIFLALKTLGLSIDLLEMCVIFPPIMGTLTCLVMFFLGKDIGGKEVGLFSALFLALNASYIGRTSWGFFDDETVGILGILLFILFFLRSLETGKHLKGSLVYAIAAGLSLGYLFSSWGASRYPVGIAVLFVLAMLLLRRYSSRLLFSYSATFGIALFMAINVPKNGFGFLTESTVLAVLGVFLLLCAYEGFGHVKTARMKTVLVFSLLVFCAILIFLLAWSGYFRPLGGKFMSVLNPFERLGRPLVESVQEHRPAAWGSFYYDLGIGAFFVPVGLFFAVRNPTNRNIFLAIFGLTSIYFASSMIRLTLLMAPALCLIWALALVRVMTPFTTLMKEAPVILRRKARFATHVGKEFSGALVTVVFLLLLFTFVLPSPRVFSQADSPTTLASASVPLRPDDTVLDWINTLGWMRENLPSTAVVASWWDYGYWITTLGNKTSLADNATWNLTQIENIGLMFMSNETEAIRVIEKFNRDAHLLGFDYNVSHVLVFTTFDLNGNDVMFGDEGKWRWMARIAARRYPEINEADFTVFNNETRSWEWTDLGKRTVIYKLMTYGKSQRVPSVPPPTLEHFELAYWSKESPIQGQIYALVAIYEVKYPTDL